MMKWRSKPRSEPKRLALENCLQALLAGAGLEQALSLHPGWADELHPLLEAAQAAAQLGRAAQHDRTEVDPHQVPGESPAASSDLAQNPLAEAVELNANGDRDAPAEHAAPAGFDREDFFDEAAERAAEQQAASRTRFLQAARRLGSPARRHRQRVGRLSLAAILALVIMFGLAFTAWFFSARALPGQALYPLKLAIEHARLSLANDSGRRLELELFFDARRLDEVNRLRAGLQPGAQPLPVTLVGILTERRPEQWVVGGVEVTIPAEVRIVGQVQPGLAIQVQGRLLPGGELIADQIQTRTYTLTGHVEAIQTGGWLVNGVPVVVTSETRIQGDVQLGSRVDLQLTLRADGRLQARLAQVIP